MSDHFYGVPAPVGSGGDFGAVVTVGTATGGNTTSAIELRIHDGITGMNKQQVALALDMIRAYILSSGTNAPA